MRKEVRACACVCESVLRRPPQQRGSSGRRRSRATGGAGTSAPAWVAADNIDAAAATIVRARHGKNVRRPCLKDE